MGILCRQKSVIIKVSYPKFVLINSPLYRLSNAIDWSSFDETFGKLYSQGIGRPAKPTRLMVGLHYLKDSLRKWLKRRSAIEPVIGHMKNDGRLGRNYLLGEEGDKINAVLCGAGHNMRKLLRAFLFFLFGWRFYEDLSAEN